MKNQIDISKLEIVELKALCYDRIVTKEQVQREIDLLNNQINKKYMEEQNTPVEVVETPTEVVPEVIEAPVEEVAPVTEEVLAPEVTE